LYHQTISISPPPKKKGKRKSLIKDISLNLKKKNISLFSHFLSLLLLALPWNGMIDDNTDDEIVEQI